MAAKSKHRWLPSRRILLLLGFLVNVLHADLVSRCSEECATVLTDDSVIDREISCNQTCQINACSTGCGLWDNTTLSTCNIACSSFYSQQSQVQYCQSGCVYAEDVYAEEVAGAIGNPTAPRIEEDSIQATSVSIDWDEASDPDVLYLLQWRYVDKDAWISYHSQPTPLPFVTVTNLKPYTSYEFRVQWVITPRHVLSSPPSRQVKTDAQGVPTSAPIIKTLLSPSSSTISVTWQPPEFPSGPLVSYTLSIQGPNGGPIRAEVPETQLSYTFLRLSASTEYAVTLEGNNMEGAGPPAEGSVTTLAGPNVTSTKPYVVTGVTSFNFDSFAEESTVSFVGLDELTQYPIPADIHVVEQENHTIQDVGVHYWKNFVFFCDTAGTIHRREIDVNNFPSGFNTSSDILYQSMGGRIVTVVDVDWLFDHIYFVEDDQILRCDLNCSEVEVAVDGLDTSPTDVRVDPYHGYLYWSQYGMGKGIYRIDLADIGADSAPSPQLVIQEDTLKSFVVDSLAYQLFYANESTFSIDGAFLDGTEKNTLLMAPRESQQDDFVNVTGLVYYNELFTWTRHSQNTDTCFLDNSRSYTRDNMYVHTGEDNFQESDVFVCPEAFHGLDVFHPSYQPYPAPASPPGSLQVLFVDTAAELTWVEPQRLDAIGKGAWQEWRYRIELTTNSGDVMSVDGEAAEAIRVTGLESGTQYNVRVRAYSTGGDGPWSDAFDGTTLKNVDEPPYLMFATDTAVMKVDLDGNNLETLIPGQSAVRDIDWYNDLALWVDSNGNIYQTDVTNPTEVVRLPLPQNAESLAVDWLGGVLYWGDLKQHKIFRIGLTSESDSSSEIAYLSDAQDLAIDAVNAYMYWTTSQSVECARLNGQEYFEYVRTADFSGDLIAGLTLDLEGGTVYWFVLSFVDGNQQLKLFRADMAGYSNNPVSTVEEIGVVDSITEKPALHHYSQKLFWINRNNEIIISDSAGQNLATLPSEAAHALSIVQKTLQPFPEGFSSPPNVIPSTIPPNSVAISGTWDDFTISWDPSSEVTYGSVLYEISVVAGNGQAFSDILSEPSYNIQTLPPYTELQISLLSYTYWAYAESIAVSMRSPQSVPSIPLNPRVFILEDKDIMSGNSTFSADLRWETVQETNGVLLGYKVYYGIAADNLMVKEVGAEITQDTLDGLMADTTYFFQVEGYTEIGSGPATTLLEATTAAASPPPTLLTLSPDGASQRDVDTQESMPLLGGASVEAVAMVFSSEDEILYWLDAVESKLKKSPLYEDDIEDLADLGSVANLGPTSLAINWVTKQLYWPEGDGIYMYDTTQTAPKVKVVGIDEGSKIMGVGVNPLQSALFWTEQDQSSTTTIMTSDLSGQDKRPLFGGARRRRRQTCTCSTDVTPGPLIVIDLSESNNGMIYFVNDDGSGDVWAADMEGCECQRVVDAASLTDSGLPPDSLSVDSKRLYWTNEAQSIVGSVDKSTGGDFQSQSADGVSFVIAFGDNLQPYPDPSCLVPQNYDQSAQLIASSSDSLSLTFDPSTSLPECAGISLATPMYTLYYKMNDTSTELEETTPALSVNLTGLEPYTYYSIQVSVANFYTTGDQPRGPAVVYRTDEGVPSKARDLIIQVLTPSSVNASWTEPADLNGDPDDLRYRIQYSPEDGSEMRYTDFEDVVKISATQFAITFGDLTEDEDYEFWVQSYPKMGDAFSLSDVVMETTFDEPEPVQMIGSTDLTLTVTWQSPMDTSVKKHVIEYAEAGLVSDGNRDSPTGADWIATDAVDTVNNTLYEVTLGEVAPLRPYAYYHVRTQVTYRSGLPYEYKVNDEIIKTFETAAGLPNAPLPPRIELIDEKQEINEVTWKEPAINGPGDLLYVLQATKTNADNWNTVYKGEDLSWRVNLTAEETYKFRVAGVSGLGQGPFSTASNDHFVVQPPPTGGGLDLTIIYAAVAGVVVLLIVIVLAVMFVLRSKAANKRKMESSMQVHFSPDQELATLRNMPTSVVNRDNTLYAVTTAANGNEVELPLFPRERLKLVTFLGSGAFGEVFEGLATDITGPETGDCRVAVKTLRKGATDEEKDEFLKEAALMGNFTDKNILGLLGVCLDNDPQFIILELMEGGDLLTYLRGARATSATAVRLSSMDLTEIILDVANGCKYLESLKFVHRDLAARNCLVNIKDYAGPNVQRCVKIGDFGLARDIYKSDYYRKEGEGLLPVRWMAPEALVDGMFSVQSDVWSYGILMWEVMTLGQQPYPARNNLDVLQYVTAGGRLGRPDNCPDDIHHIMLKCWEQTAEGRPSFRTIVDMLESYRRNSNVGGIDNQGFETSAGMNVKYTRLQDPAMQEYLLPMDSAQSLSDPTVPGARSRPPDISIIPDDDIAQQKAANRDQNPRRTKSTDNQRRNSPSAPRRAALDAAVENLHSPVPREKGLEPRYHAFPPKGSMGKASGAKVRKAAPQIPDDGPPLDAPGRPKSQHGPMIDPEGSFGRSSGNGVAAAAAAMHSDEPPPALHPRRHPNPFRKNSFDESDKRQYVNLPDDSQVSAFANV